MKQTLLVCAAMFAITSFAFAQDAPQYELFVGGSYLHAHASGGELDQLVDVPAIQFQQHNINLNLLGWDSSITENVNSWFGAEFDASGFYGTPAAGFLYPSSQLVSPNPNFSKGVPVTTRVQTFMFGPHLSMRGGGRVSFFAHLPVGVAYVNTSLSESAVVGTNFSVLPVGTLKSSTGLALSPGVGMDLRMNGRVTIRPFQLDYLMTHVFGQRQDNVRVSAGVNLTFGEK